MVKTNKKITKESLKCFFLFFFFFAFFTLQTYIYFNRDTYVLQ